MSISQALAATYEWTGATNTTWGTSTNWSPNGIPTSSDIAIIDLTAGSPVVAVSGAQASQVLLGNTASGSLSIQSGGTLTDQYGYVGYNFSTTGTVTVTGSGSSWVNNTELLIGNNGTGILNVQNGGQVTANNANFLFIGTNSGSAGTMNISSGGSVTSGITFLGFNTGAPGAVTVTGAGSTWTNTGINIGNSGNGSFTVSNGGVVTTNGGSIISNGSGTGTVLVTGAGSQWNLTNGISIGNGTGSASMTISNGAAVSVVSNSFVGQGSGTDVLLIDGKGSSFSTSSLFFSGYSGTGAVVIQNGGTLYDAGGGYIGATGGIQGVGTVIVTGPGSSWTSEQYLTIGKQGGTGSLTVSNGARVNVTRGYIGQDSGSVGNVAVTGSGSALTSATDLYIGAGPGTTGTVTLSYGGAVTVTSGTPYNSNHVSTGTVYITSAAGATGTLNIGAPAGSPAAPPGIVNANAVQFGTAASGAGTGTLVFNHTSLGYVFAPAVIGNGTIDIISGTTLFTGNMSRFTGTIDFDPAPGAIVGVTTPSAQQATVETLGQQQQQAAVQSRATANALLGMTRPMDSNSYVYAMHSSEVRLVWRAARYLDMA